MEKIIEWVETQVIWVESIIWENANKIADMIYSGNLIDFFNSITMNELVIYGWMIITPILIYLIVRSIPSSVRADHLQVEEKNNNDPEKTKQELLDLKEQCEQKINEFESKKLEYKEYIENLKSEMKVNISEYVSDFESNLKENLSELRDEIKELLEEAVSDIKDSLENKIEDIGISLQETKDNIEEEINNYNESIDNGSSDFYEDFNNTGHILNKALNSVIFKERKRSFPCK